jgi:hypothetical protein
VVRTQLGNDHFAAFAATASKSRLNFLELLRAGYRDHVLNAEALTYMRQRSLAGPVIARLAAHPERHFPDEAAWRRHLERLGMAALTVTPDPVRIATEGAVWGSIKAHGLLPDTVILSEARRQRRRGPVRARPARFVLASCRARLVHKLDTFTDWQHDAAQQVVRALIRWFYADLKAYRREPNRRRRHELRARFDRIIFRRRPGFAKLDRLLARLHANKQEPLLVLDRPAGDSAAHQRLGARPAPAGGQTEALRRHAVGRRPRLPRRLPRSAADLRQARRVVLELSRPPLRRARGRSAVPARSRQAPLSPSLSARAFAPRTAAIAAAPIWPRPATWKPRADHHPARRPKVMV